MKSPRMLVCEKTKTEFPYSGRGRPPRYCPEVAVSMAAERRRAAYQARKARKAAGI